MLAIFFGGLTTKIEEVEVRDGVVIAVATEGD